MKLLIVAALFLTGPCIFIYELIRRRKRRSARAAVMPSEEREAANAAPQIVDEFSKVLKGISTDCIYDEQTIPSGKRQTLFAFKELATRPMSDIEFNALCSKAAMLSRFQPSIGSLPIHPDEAYQLAPTALMTGITAEFVEVARSQGQPFTILWPAVMQEQSLIIRQMKHMRSYY